MTYYVCFAAVGRGFVALLGRESEQLWYLNK